MDGAMLIVAAVLFFGGLSMVLVALKHRTAKHPPVPSFNPKHWKPIWMMRDYYTPTGYRLQLVGWIAAGIACVLLILRSSLSM